jgi:ABC-type Fe3+/spermidine/putrescine transport system ATPase subunit
MTVFENIAYPLKLRGVPRAELRQRVDRVLALINLSGLTDKTIPQLSGGQQQRVALARALVYEPSLMLFDEPFSNLDTQLRGQMRLELKMLRRKVAMTGLFVTHDQIEALSMADRVAIMRDGRVEQVGAPQEVYRQPRTRFVRDFLGRTVTLHGQIEQRGAEIAVRLPESETALSVASGLPRGMASGDRVELSIRPEFVSLLSDQDIGRPNSLQATVEDLLFTGERFEARMRIGRDSILFDLPPDRGWREGQAVRLCLPAESVSLWPEEGTPA